LPGKALFNLIYFILTYISYYNIGSVLGAVLKFNIKVLVVVLVLVAAAYFLWPLIQATSKTPHEEILSFWDDQDIPILNNEFDLLAVPDSKFIDVKSALNAFKSRTSSASDQALADIYLVLAELTQIKKQSAVLAQEISLLPTDQVCASISQFEASTDKIEEMAQKALELTQKIDVFEENYSEAANNLALSDLKPNLDAFQSIYLTSLENVKELKTLCG
jgi:hypothetical protein